MNCLKIAIQRLIWPEIGLKREKNLYQGKNPTVMGLWMEEAALPPQRSQPLSLDVVWVPGDLVRRDLKRKNPRSVFKHEEEGKIFLALLEDEERK